MGGKHSRLQQREQKHQLRKQTACGEERQRNGEQEQQRQGDNFDTVPDVTAARRESERVRLEHETAESEDGTRSSVTITICMLKMEPNGTAGTEAEDVSPTVSNIANQTEETTMEEGVAGRAEAAEDVSATDDGSLECACIENGNFSPAETATSSDNTVTPRCGCSSNAAAATETIDNRLNNNNEHLPAAAPMASNLSTASPNSPSVVQAAGTPLSFMIGGHDPATLSHLLHRLRHLHHHHHHHHLHHHHHHPLMHLHHLHHHVPAGELPTEASPASNPVDWRQQSQPWIPAGIVGSSNGAPVRPLDSTVSTVPAVSLATTTPAASPLFLDIDIDLKDKLEGLKLGCVPAGGQRSSNNNVPDTTGEHPYSVGECPTCCAMAMAANASASASLGGLQAAAGSGACGSSTPVYNGNAGEVEEKILNTTNQPTAATGGEAVPEMVTSQATSGDGGGGASCQSNDQISTEQPDSSAAATGSSSVASPSGSAASGSAVTEAPNTDGSSGKDAAAGATVDDNSSKQAIPTTPTSSSSSNVVSTGSANTASDSQPAATVRVGTGISKASATASSASSAVSCCNNRKSSSTLFGSLSFTGRRSRSSNARPGSCCSNGATGEGLSGSSEQQQQQQRSRISWIPGSGQKQQRNSNGAKNARTDTTATTTTAGSTKTKKSNWPFSLKYSGGGSSQVRTNTGATVSANHKQTTKGSGAASGSGASTAAAMSLDASNSILSAVAGGSSLRGSTLIASAKLLKGESDKDDSCVCTAYRKVSESPPPPSSSPVPPATSASPATAGPSRMAGPRPTESVEWLEEAIQGTGLVPLNLHMLSSLRAGNAGGSTAGAAGVSAPLISLSPEPLSAAMLPAANHHHHHHHAMAATLMGDHHPAAFFFQPAVGTANHHHAHGAAGVAGASGAGGGTLFGTLPLGAGHPPSANDVILLSDSPVLFDLASDDFSLEDCDERARIQRELEIREGVDAPPNFHPRRLMSGGTIASGPAANHPIAFIYSRDLMQRGLLMANKLIQPLDAAGGVCVARSGFGRLRIHSQVDFIHCLVPDLQKITSCSFYWGKMDRYEAERLLEGKPEGTFLLRDSAQEEFLFSVSFRKYNRSLHARIEQFNHKFSFDSRDPGVFTASTVTGLLEHYKDPSCVMFFEPMLTFPLNRNFSFSLQQLCRAVIVSNTTYDGINELTLPKSLKSYLKEYHYRQRVRFRPMDEHLYSNA
uniref:Suppressor of cytokine signaling 5 n=1 Tax=Anopheles epiroticus TaxID=199890 RepID=A0A182PHC1_9DIPT